MAVNIDKARCQHIAVGDYNPSGHSRDVPIQRSKAISRDGRIADPSFCPGSVSDGCAFD
jgi:hypothetical protein